MKRGPGSGWLCGVGAQELASACSTSFDFTCTTSVVSWSQARSRGRSRASANLTAATTTRRSSPSGAPSPVHGLVGACLAGTVSSRIAVRALLVRGAVVGVLYLRCVTADRDGDASPTLFTRQPSIPCPQPPAV
eukprot:2202023-Pleurochrysis_carterae.AAC.1